MAATWLASANVRDPGPTSNLDGYGSGVPNGGNPYGNQMLGVINHSAEGYFGSTSPSSVMRARGNSWHITIYKSGHVVQSYPLEAMCWHAGSKANYRYIGIEHEGKAGEALTTAQLAATIRVNAEIARIRGWASVKRGVTGFQHNDFMATSCPSGRIPWAKIEAGTRVFTAPTITIWSEVKQVSLSVTLQEATYLVKLPDKTKVKLLAKGTKLSVKGVWKGIYYLTPYSFDKRIPNGFAVSATVVKTTVDPCKDVKAELASAKSTITSLSKQLTTIKTKLVDADKLLAETIRIKDIMMATVNSQLVASHEEIARMKKQITALTIQVHVSNTFRNSLKKFLGI